MWEQWKVQVTIPLERPKGQRQHSGLCGWYTFRLSPEMGQRSKEMWNDMERRWLQQQWNEHRQSHIHIWQIKIRRDTLGVSDSSPRPDHTIQSSSARKINPRNFWL